MHLPVTLTRLAGSPGRPVVVLGPSLGTRVDRLWRACAGDLGDVEVLGWDLPGHGHSPATTHAFDLADLASAVLAAVDAHRDAPTRIAYAGDSIGGAVGLQLALDHPDRLSSVAVVCSAARFGVPQGWTDRAAAVRAEGTATLLPATPARWFGSRVLAHPSDTSRAALRDLLAVDAESYARTCEALAAFDVRDRLSEITTPLLALAGADDVATPAADHQDLAQQVRRGRFAVLRGVGHLAPLEDPARTAGLLREHLATTYEALPSLRA